MQQVSYGCQCGLLKICSKQQWHCEACNNSHMGICVVCSNALISGKQRWHHAAYREAHIHWYGLLQNQWQAASASCNMQQIPCVHRCSLLKRHWQAALAPCSMQQVCMCISMVCSTSVLTCRRAPQLNTWSDVSSASKRLGAAESSVHRS